MLACMLRAGCAAWKAGPGPAYAATPAMPAWALQGPEDDGGSTIQSYDVEIRPKSAAAVQGLADEWLLAYQVGPGGMAARPQASSSAPWPVVSPATCVLRLCLHPPGLAAALPCPLPQGRDTACTISNLRAGCVYMLRACAVSQAGRGAYGGVAMLQTAPGSPGERGPVWRAPAHSPARSQGAGCRLQAAVCLSCRPSWRTGATAASHVRSGVSSVHLPVCLAAIGAQTALGRRWWRHGSKRS